MRGELVADLGVELLDEARRRHGGLLGTRASGGLLGSRLLGDLLPSTRTSLRFLTVYPEGRRALLEHPRAGSGRTCFLDSQHSRLGSSALPSPRRDPSRRVRQASPQRDECRTSRRGVAARRGGPSASRQPFSAMTTRSAEAPWPPVLCLAPGRPPDAAATRERWTPTSVSRTARRRACSSTRPRVRRQAAAEQPARRARRPGPMPAQEQRAAEVDVDAGAGDRGRSLVSTRPWAATQADEVFDAVNAGIRADLATYAAPLRSIEAFGASAPRRLDELSQARAPPVRGPAGLLAQRGAAAGLVDGVHTGSGTDATASPSQRPATRAPCQRPRRRRSSTGSTVTIGTRREGRALPGRERQGRGRGIDDRLGQQGRRRPPVQLRGPGRDPGRRRRRGRLDVARPSPPSRATSAAARSSTSPCQADARATTPSPRPAGTCRRTTPRRRSTAALIMSRLLANRLVASRRARGSPGAMRQARADRLRRPARTAAGGVGHHHGGTAQRHRRRPRRRDGDRETGRRRCRCRARGQRR